MAAASLSVSAEFTATSAIPFSQVTFTGLSG
jgi:hypothetical protein